MKPADALAKTLANGAASLYAVVDGAKFGDPARMLRDYGLRALALFLEHPRRPAPAAGPLLVPLDRHGLDRLLDIAEIETAAVFWNASVDEPRVFRHLRGINQVRIPLQGEAAGRWQTQGKEAVLFRHWDPSVMALAFPLLDDAQRSRLFGPLGQLTLYSADLARPLQATAKPDWPPPPRGPLTFSPDQMDEIADAMKARSRRNVARYLRRTAGQQTASMDDAALSSFVAASEGEARSWGLRTEAGFGRFACLRLATAGGLAQMAPARSFVETAGADPDQQLRRLMQAVAHRLSAPGGVPA